MAPRRRPHRSAQRTDDKGLHPTAALLLSTTSRLLETLSMDEVSLAMVLEESGVSHGSVYHHFEDFPDLVEQAVVSRYEQGLKESFAGVVSLLDSADAAEFRARTEELIRSLHAKERQPYRATRLGIFGSLEIRPRLAERISQAQEQHRDREAELFAEFQRRGWMRADLDPAAMSCFASATFLGRVVDDVVEHPVNPDHWTEVALIALRAVLFPD